MNDTKVLLRMGVAAGLIYVVTALVQSLTRSGFDPTRHDVSLLANGGLGWIQIANFLVSGALTVACAVGLRRALRSRADGADRGGGGGGGGGAGHRGSFWGPVLLGVYGAGVFAAGLFRADPSDGFPPGTPAGHNTDLSWPGALHFSCAAIGFFALIAACFVIASRLSRQGARGFAAYSRVTGVLFLAGFVGVASGSGSRPVVIAFWVAVILAWTWIALLAVRSSREIAEGAAR